MVGNSVNIVHTLFPFLKFQSNIALEKIENQKFTDSSMFGLIKRNDLLPKLSMWFTMKKKKKAKEIITYRKSNSMINENMKYEIGIWVH